MFKSLPFLLCLFMCALSPSMAQTPKPDPKDSASIAQAMAFLQTQEHIPKAPQAIQSPNAASLGSYGEIPVSLYTGKPEINVNLHTVSDGNVNIPISLSYDASGVRPDVHAGWVGLNFNLSTNYSITRTVRNFQDETATAAYGYLSQVVRDLLNYGAANWLDSDVMKDYAFNSGGYDTETDEYSFNAPGFSGKFYMGQDSKWKVECTRPVKIELISTLLTITPPFTPPSWTNNYWHNSGTGKYMPHVTGFYITDEEGTRYEFGGTNAYNEYSIDFFEQGRDNWICNAWYLKSIRRNTGQQTTFTYERGNFVAQMYFSAYNKSSRINGGAWVGCAQWSSLFNKYGPFNGKLISPIYLKEISADNFKVKFTSTNSSELPYSIDVFNQQINARLNDEVPKLNFLTFLYSCVYPIHNHSLCNNPAETTEQLLAKLKWRKLDKIEIQNGSSITTKEFVFTYNNIATERLMLKYVQEKSGTKVIPVYEFSYFADDVLKLPDYCKSHTDHWGFNNGKPINVNNDFNVFSSYGTTYRTPATDIRYLKLGSLTSIKYPAGGLTKFVLEPHSFTKEVKLRRWEGEDAFATNQRAGGLRVKEIHNYDNVSQNTIKKKYYYLASFNPASPDTSAAVLSSGVLGGKTQYWYPNYKPKAEDPSINVEEQIFSTQSVLPASENSLGSHIGYSNVIEWVSTEGWNVHSFSNFDNGYRDSAPDGYIQEGSTPYQPYNSKAFQRGKLLKKSIYKQNGSPASELSYKYELVGTLADYSARAVKADVRTLCATENLVYEATAYTIDVRKYLPTQQITTTYDQDNAAAFSTRQADYTYWPNGQLYVDSRNDSRGRAIKTWYKYPPNSATAPHPAMTLAHNIATPYEVLQYTGTEAAPSPIKLQTVTFHSTSPYLPQKVESRLGAAGPMITDMGSMTYDGRGNLLTYTERNGLTTKLEYYGTADIGKADQLKKRTTGEGSALAQATAYDYKPAVGIQNITDANAKAILYDYDAFNRLVTIKNPSGSARATYCYNYAGQVVDCAALAPTGSIAASSLVLIAGSPPLPVTLVEFNAVKNEKTAALSWSTASETNSERFDIERSSDGKQWIKLGSVLAQGESTGLQRYTYLDTAPKNGENLYRLKMLDADGTFAYSRIRSLAFGENGSLALYPNPVGIGDNLNLLTDELDKISTIRIFDTTGKWVQESGAAAQISTAGLAAGLYMVQITYTDGSISTHRVVKQ